MRSLRRKYLALCSTALAGVILTGVPDASAQNLFDMLFGQNRTQRVEPQPMPQEVRPAPRAAAPRVAGPQYYDYRTEALVKLDFAAITPAPGPRAAVDGMIDSGTVGSTEFEADDGVTVVAQLQSDSAAEEILTDVVSDDAEDAAAQPRTAAEIAEDAAQHIAEEAPTEPAPTVGDNLQVVEEVVPEPLTAEMLAGLDAYELLAEKQAAEAIVAHYSQQPELMWVSDGAPSARAGEALRVLGDAKSHGLDPADYAVALPTRAGGDGTQADLARFEMELSARVLRYVRDARAGRVDPNRISGYHDFAEKPLDLEAELRSLRMASDIEALLESHHPRNSYYRALRAELAELRRSAENEIVIAPRTLIKPGETNPEFSKILTLIDMNADEAFRAEHGELLAAHLGSDTYARELVPLIKAAQKANRLQDDGVIGPRTVLALAGDSKADRIEKVQVALEQIRWLPSDLGGRYVFLNTPAFNASYFEGGEEKLSMRAIYGNSSTQTYFFQDEIDYVEFHPFWGVPRSILVNKYLSRLIDDPGYLDRAGFEVTNSRGQRIPSASIDWGQYGANVPYDVRQRPGRSNALGELKIMFPNRHAIYMHDTPDKHLFDRDNRALSNGCIRLQDPRAMAAAVLGWSREEIVSRLEQPHSRADLAVKVPVYVSYFTAWPDKAGTVHYFGDVYDRDRRIRDALTRVERLRAPSA